ncbi:MAG: DUF4965 domain-containing protein [Spirochaetes bacterium]|nr:DUF4965 domain-containing protein [Spirochaetota bacterium]
MQLMGDGIAVLGSRLGIVMDPVNRKAFLVRHGVHPGIPIEIKAGIKLKDRTVFLPLTSEKEYFDFTDQSSSACSISLSGIDPETSLHLKLIIRIPFRPGNFEFSTTPVIYFDLEVDRLSSQFRWTEGTTEDFVSGSIFLEFAGEGFKFTQKNDDSEVTYQSKIVFPAVAGIDVDDFPPVNISSADRLAAVEGYRKDGQLQQDFKLARGRAGKRLSAAWCIYDEPVLNVLGEKCPFYYTTVFSNINEVCKWAVENAENVRLSANTVDGLFAKHNLGEAVNHLMRHTLHSWLVNTWMVVRPDGQKWFSVWEGSCYFHSTVDVEYTQSPFYLSVWPELLELQLDEWPFFGKNGSAVLGEDVENTLFLSHDIGFMTECTRQFYPHEMEVEENSNYIQLAYAYWRRTGNDSLIRKHESFITQLMDFIIACDTTGNGIPDKGCANTIDDASPAIQFGSEQVYLGVKAMTSIRAGFEILKYLGKSGLQKYTEFVEKAVNTIETTAWLDDHYAVTLSRTLDGILNPWSGEMMKGELEGWDAYHIYTSNGLVPMEMVGMKNLLDITRIKSDIINSLAHTKGKYGSRHTSYVDKKPTDLFVPGLAGSAPQVGWVSMNMFRDMAAAYRGVDLFSMAQNYWDWQCTTNSQNVSLFFETFYGNNLCFYPRGIAVFGYMEASLGFSYDKVEGNQKLSPVRDLLEVALFVFADWEKGTVPVVKSSFKNGVIEYDILK